MITLNIYSMTLPINFIKTIPVFLLNLILHIFLMLFTIIFLTWVSYFNYYSFGQIFDIYVIGIIFIIALKIYNIGKISNINLYDSILDILLELFDNPLHFDEEVSIGVDDVEPSEKPEGTEGDQGPEGGPERDPEGDPEGDPEDDPNNNDKKRKRSEDLEDDSEEEREQKKGKIDKGKGIANPDDISDDDYDKYGYRDAKDSEDEKSWYDYQNSDEDDDDAYLAESLDRKDELEKKLEGASPEEKERILNEIEVLTDLINNLLN